MDSAYAKLGRAQEHLGELKESVDTARAEDLSGGLSAVVNDHPTDPSLALLTLTLQKQQAPEEWSLMMGDILTNLRAALDHAVYGHADRRQQLNSRQRKDLKYPIFTEEHDWIGAPEQFNPDGTVRKPARVGARDELGPLVDPAVLAVIETSQPFNAQNGPPTWHGLALLSGLVNRDKHRAVHEVPINIADLMLDGADVDVVSSDPAQTLPDGAIRITAVVRRPRRAGGAEPKDVLVNFRAVAAYIEEIELPRVNDHRPFLTVMEALVKMVGDLLDELKAAGC